MAEEKALIDRLPPEASASHDLPSVERMMRAERAVTIVRRVLNDHLRPDGLRVSPLGPGWSRDIDVHVHRWPDEALLRDAGWLPLDSLLARIGSRECGGWAVVEDGEVLYRVDIHDGPPPDPVSAILERCRRRGEVRIREALELRRLALAGTRLPGSHPAIRAAAAIEARLGGDGLASYRGWPPTSGPVGLRKPLWRRLARRVRNGMRPRIAVALSGVDGSGKSTVARCLRSDLERAGVPVGAVWARPGLHLGALTRLSRRIKPLLGQAPGPGVRTVARGNGSRLPSRRGFVGWIWSLLVTLAFLADVWRQHLAAQGVVLYDRHVTDAVVTLDVLYSGPDLRVQRALARRLMPRTTLTAYLTIDPETAAGRKPGDMIGLQAIRAQLDRYEAEVAGLEPLLRLDGVTPPQYNAREIVERLLALA